MQGAAGERSSGVAGSAGTAYALPMIGTESDSAPAGKLRLFIAVVPSPAALSGLRSALEAARTLPSAAPLRWTESERLHLTLQFLGSVDARRVPAIVEACQPIAHEAAPFELTLAGAGAFPSHGRAAVVWIGATRGAEQLTALAKKVNNALEPLGFEPEARAFTPHLTVARSKPPSAQTNTVRSLSSVQLTFQVRELVLVHSKLQGAKPSTYHPLQTLALGDGSR